MEAILITNHLQVQAVGTIYLVLKVIAMVTTGAMVNT